MTATTPKLTTTPAPETTQEDANAVDDSHKEAPSTAANQPDPDEGEEKLFAEKAMLYRFDKEGNEWKERGVGLMKILQNKENKRCRILMRRNQTFRVCANHFILPFMELKPHTGNERAFIWSATDFADGTESHDVLSVRFKTSEIAQDFKKAFDKAREINTEELKKIEGGEEKKEEEKKEEEKKE
ncbi:Ran-specific GTPase-activating protein [Tritrichomonas musculus]|uniref:Ran-specific GTPase-activating protein n=1 Tax=Tritrichomonas musculus TaxID=1915356 RepID=A0ABR2KUR9_9EUKA